jgi:hypothetical protein
MAQITIPAAYLEDVRTAVIAAVRDDGTMLQSNHQEVLDGSVVATEDRVSTVRCLVEDLSLLDQVLAADSETTVTGDSCAIGHVLQRLARVFIDRLIDETQYTPVPMRAVLDLTSQVQWAAGEAIRVCPSDFDRVEA